MEKCHGKMRCTMAIIAIPPYIINITPSKYIKRIDNLYDILI